MAGLWPMDGLGGRLGEEAAVEGGEKGDLEGGWTRVCNYAALLVTSVRVLSRRGRARIDALA